MNAKATSLHDDKSASLHDVTETPADAPAKAKRPRRTDEQKLEAMIASKRKVIERLEERIEAAREQLDDAERQLAVEYPRLRGLERALWGSDPLEAPSTTEPAGEAST